MPRFNQETGAHLTNGRPSFLPSSPLLSKFNFRALALLADVYKWKGKRDERKLKIFQISKQNSSILVSKRVPETTGSRTLESTPARGFKKITYVKGFLASASHVCPRGRVFRPAITSAHYDIRNFYLDDGGRTTLEPRNTRPRVTK